MVRFFSFFLMVPPPPASTLFPYTTLFRSSATLPMAASRSKKLPRFWLVNTETTIGPASEDRKSTRLNSSHQIISYAVFCFKKNNQRHQGTYLIKHQNNELHTGTLLLNLLN